ncbi:MAG: amidohydrolase [Planctomycetes bacterium]|nr:amidohydrolase [Planctomycetota bacterium]
MAEPDPAQGVIDLHVHISPHGCMHAAAQQVIDAGRHDLDVIHGAIDDPGVLLRHMDDQGVRAAAVINYPSPDVIGYPMAVNEFVARYRDHAPQRLLAVGGAHPRFERDMSGTMRHLLDDLRLDMVKVHPPHQLFAANAYVDGLDPLRVLYAECQRRRVPVMVHTGTSVFPGARCKFGRPMELDDVAVDFPELPLVMAHGGRPLWCDEAFFVVRRHRNIWLEISGIPPGALLEYFPRLEQVADRVLWGTDWPSPGVRDMRTNVARFLALPLDPAAKDRILRGNALRLFPRLSG